ncbi:uncharacterized protein LOC141607012 [Silene latifolia]|uniref:uncharacterized protein LOC141607012 n=1 Tax=Silene latifolia TaxID=37657 RepID=UPI003D785300
MRNFMISRNATSRKHRANILWMKRVIQTCFVLAFGIWVVNQLKLFVSKENVKTDMFSEFSTRKTLKISTELVETKHVEGDKEETERNEELTENWIDDFDNQIFEKAESMNDTSSRVHGAEDAENGWESSLVNGSDNFESLDTSVSEFDQDEKEDNLDVEIREETTRIEEVSQEDAADQ